MVYVFLVTTSDLDLEIMSVFECLSSLPLATCDSPLAVVLSCEFRVHKGQITGTCFNAMRNALCAMRFMGGDVCLS
jgi:hypothetical protein